LINGRLSLSKKLPSDDKLIHVDDYSFETIDKLERALDVTLMTIAEPPDGEAVKGIEGAVWRGSDYGMGDENERTGWTFGEPGGVGGMIGKGCRKQPPICLNRVFFGGEMGGSFEV
jgi:hypothetical protein